jgi:hypothetical protein
VLPPAFLVAAGLFAGSAWADIINIPLTQPNEAISGFPSPYGNVKVDLNAAGNCGQDYFHCRRDPRLRNRAASDSSTNPPNPISQQY